MQEEEGEHEPRRLLRGTSKGLQAKRNRMAGFFRVVFFKSVCLTGFWFSRYLLSSCLCENVGLIKQI